MTMTNSLSRKLWKIAPNVQDAQHLMVAKQNGNASMVIGSTIYNPTSRTSIRTTTVSLPSRLYSKIPQPGLRL